jgi:hypothetical protein
MCLAIWAGENQVNQTVRSANRLFAILACVLYPVEGEVIGSNTTRGRNYVYCQSNHS